MKASKILKRYKEMHKLKVPLYHLAEWMLDRDVSWLLSLKIREYLIHYYSYKIKVLRSSRAKEVRNLYI
ncbi:MAG: hypothetical protein NE330_02755, partial [Lentisphaeraceae bacterium]|nr:hypothetical protein [Lentisphaeraceae bacterium]